MKESAIPLMHRARMMGIDMSSLIPTGCNFSERWSKVGEDGELADESCLLRRLLGNVYSASARRSPDVGGTARPSQLTSSR